MYLGGAPGYKTRMVSVGVSERALCPWLGGSIVGESFVSSVLHYLSWLFLLVTFLLEFISMLTELFCLCFVVRPAASLGSFHELWVSRQEYEEFGTSIIDRKCP